MSRAKTTLDREREGQPPSLPRHRSLSLSPSFSSRKSTPSPGSTALRLRLYIVVAAAESRLMKVPIALFWLDHRSASMLPFSLFLKDSSRCGCGYVEAFGCCCRKQQVVGPRWVRLTIDVGWRDTCSRDSVISISNPAQAATSVCFRTLTDELPLLTLPARTSCLSVDKRPSLWVSILPLLLLLLLFFSFHRFPPRVPSSLLSHFRESYELLP